MTGAITGKPFGKSRKPGFLLEPLGWVLDRLSKAIEAEPRLIEMMFGLAHSRMHVVALALAHIEREVTPDLAVTLLQEPRNAVLKHSLDHCPVGIDRVLSRLPRKVMPVESYRRLTDLLKYPATAGFLHHSPWINERTITGLHRLPAILRRPAIMAMLDQITGRTRFVDGLRFLASRQGLPFDALVDQIGALDQPEQIAARMRQLVETLPLPDTLPAFAIGEFRRIDCVAEIRELANDWHNCLADYLSTVNDGTAAVYLSERAQAVCLVIREGRIGWCLLQAKGPINVDIKPDQLAQIHADFAAAGIPETAIIEPIRSTIHTSDWSRPADDEEEAFDGAVLC